MTRDVDASPPGINLPKRVQEHFANFDSIGPGSKYREKGIGLDLNEHGEEKVKNTKCAGLMCNHFIKFVEVTAVAKDVS